LAANRIGRATEYALTIASAAESADPLALAKKRVAEALHAGYEALFADHCRWWRDYWATSSIQAPDVEIQRHYDLTQYFFGSSSRKNAPPIPLQGVWTADEGALPPWKGDYHNDLNTQLTYWAYPAAGHFTEGESFLDFLWNLLPEHRRFAQTFYEVPGAVLPGVMGLDGKPIGGWPQYSLSPTNGAWAAQAFYWHWRYTLDEKFLVERAIPYCSALAEALTVLLKKNPHGKLKLALSSSPEIHNNKPTAWLTPNSNYDLAILRWFFDALAQMTEVAGDHAAANRARGVLADLDDLTVEDEQTPAPRVKDALCLSPNEPFRESHRHHSHLLAIYPLGLIHVEGSEWERRVIESSLRQIDALGFGAWVGYSFTWMACINARCGRAEKAWEYLQLYLQAFVSNNGFHLNGDFKKILPEVRHKYRPFTLEGNFAAAQAVHEMLLQSWGGTVRVFPAVPQVLSDVSFENLRAEGAFRVSARSSGGRTQSVRVVSEKGGRLRLRNTFGEIPPKWNREDVRRMGNDFECSLPAGEALEGVVQR
jgi:alpha-L-fucosidase 2